jgi:hypothetical protein
MYLDNYDDFSSINFYEQIWGHRFKIGQSSYELFLEFLNVFYGAEYLLGCSYYKKIKNVNLRRLLFNENSSTHIANLVTEDINEFINFIRKYTIYSEKRKNWGAMFLLPINESLLFVELRDKGKKGEAIGVERNIFARGGELYYLMLSNAANDENKKIIQRSISYYMRLNPYIKDIVEAINSKINSEPEEPKYGILESVDNFKDKVTSDMLDKLGDTNNYPILTNVDIAFFDLIANQLANLLKNNINQIEMLENIRMLISIHVCLYIYVTAYQGVQDTMPKLFIDCTYNGEESEIKRLAVKSLKNNENIMSKKVEHEHKVKFKKICELIYQKYQADNNYSPIEDLRTVLGIKTVKGGDGDSKGNRAVLNSVVEELSELLFKAECLENFIQGASEKASKKILQIYVDQYNKNFKPIPKDMLKETGLASYKIGENYRYVINDKVISVLVLSLVQPGHKIEFNNFLDLVYKNYGFVIGFNEANTSGIYQGSGLNIKYFDKNLEAFKDRLRNSGYLREYSDATAMIENRNQRLECN